MRITPELLRHARKVPPGVDQRSTSTTPARSPPKLAEACDRLADAGVPLGNQTVLLRGVNDSVDMQRELIHGLLMMPRRPYYLYQCDLVVGSGHLRTPVVQGLEIMEGLRGHTSGYAVPTYVIDAPGGGGKIPVMPNYMISSAPGKVVLRNFEGFITTYSEPTDYDPEAIRSLEAQLARRPEPGQSGVLGLLEGERMTIEPEGFGSTHTRSDLHHRLNADTHKWQPLGIGAAPAVEAHGGNGDGNPPTETSPGAIPGIEVEVKE